MRILARLAVVVGAVVAALAATVVVAAIFPPLLIVLLLAASIAFGWWGVGTLRRREHRFLGVVAVCASPAMLLAALALAFAFAPISSGPSSHSSPIAVEPSSAP
jgi:hypothetical protein